MFGFPVWTTKSRHRNFGRIHSSPQTADRRFPSPGPTLHPTSCSAGRRPNDGPKTRTSLKQPSPQGSGRPSGHCLLLPPPQRRIHKAAQGATKRQICLCHLNQTVSSGGRGLLERRHTASSRVPAEHPRTSGLSNSKNLQPEKWPHGPDTAPPINRQTGRRRCSCSTRPPHPVPRWY